MTSPIALPAQKTFTTERIDPATAERYLDQLYEGQRRMKPSKVKHYKRLMLAGKWRANGEPIIFDEFGKLIQGQHRLQAVIEAGVTVEMDVLRGVPREVFPTLDRPTVRSVADLLGPEVKDKSLVGSLGRIVWFFLRSTDEKEVFRFANHSSARIKPEPEEIEELYKTHGEQLRDAIDSTRVSRSMGIASWQAFLYWYYGYFSRISKESLREFFADFGRGENLSTGSPALAARNAFFRSTTGNMRAVDRRDLLCAILLRGLKTHLAGRQVTVLRHTLGDNIPSLKL